MNIFVVRMYVAHSWDVNTFRWILVYQLFIQYIPTTSKLNHNYKNIYLNYEKGQPYYEKLHPICEQTTSQLRTTRKGLKIFKKGLISLKSRQILGKCRKQGHYFWLSFVLTEFCLALMFPFKQVLVFVKLQS